MSMKQIGSKIYVPTMIAIIILAICSFVHDAVTETPGDRATKKLVQQIKNDRGYYFNVYIPAVKQYTTNYNANNTSKDDAINHLNECISSLKRIDSADPKGVSPELFGAVSKWENVSRDLAAYRIRILQAWFPDRSKMEPYTKNESDAETEVDDLMIRMKVWDDPETLKKLKEAIDLNPTKYFADEQAVKDRIAPLK